MNDWSEPSQPRPPVCPLLSIVGEEYITCWRGGCAWWVAATDNDYSACAVTVLAQRANNISYYQRIQAGA